MERTEIERIVKECIDELFKKDHFLLEYDVNERSITHKLAEYLQSRISELNVDCEYNRNTLLGRQSPKKIMGMPQGKYPDIIVHRRGTHDENLLILEVKKDTSNERHDQDYKKLEAFTECSEQNSYCFKYGIFLIVNTGSNWSNPPKLEWFIDGKKENP